jgi:hypothetical protein
MTAKIKLNAASGGGSFSLQAPSSSSNNRVLTLPDTADGTIAKTSDIDLVKITDASWTSAVSTVSVDNLDTTTYKYFKMLWNHKPSEQGRRLSFRWRQNSTDQTTAAYDWNFGRYYGASTNYIAENADKVEVTDDMGHDLNEGCQLIFEIYPKTSAENGYHGNAVFWHGIFHENATYVRGISGSAFYDGGTTYYPNGFKLYMNVGNLEQGNYVVYGVKR